MVWYLNEPEGNFLQELGAKVRGGCQDTQDTVPCCSVHLPVPHLQLLFAMGPQRGLGQKGHLKVIKSNTPAEIKDIFSGIISQSPVQPDLECFREGAPTISPCNLFCCFTIFTLKNVFPTPSLNLSAFSLKPLPLVLLPQALQNVCPFLINVPTFCD